MSQGELFSQLNNDDWSKERMELLKALWFDGKTIEQIAAQMKAPIGVVAGKVSKVIKEES